jgi:hypothetical protein
LQVLKTLFISPLACGFSSRIHQVPLRQSRLKNQTLIDQAMTLCVKSLHGFALLP